MIALQVLGCGALVYLAAATPAEVYGQITVNLTGLAFMVLGTVIVSTRSENRIGWLCSLTGLSLMMMSFAVAYPRCGLPGSLWVAWLANALILLPLYLMFILLPLWFPTGQYLSLPWRRLAQAFALLLAGVILVISYWPSPLVVLNNVGAGTFPNPIGLNFLPHPRIDSFLRPAPNLIVIAGAILANASLFIRWRSSTGETRQQIKWLAYFVITVATIYLFLIQGLANLFYRELLDTWFYLAALTIVWLGYPLIIGIAVLRYRLYDIDLIIRRTLLYSSLTLILGLVYAATVILLQYVIDSLTPGESQSQINIVISTLAIAALFNPLRRRLQNLIDRRYYRHRLDPEHLLAKMRAGMQNEVELDNLSDTILAAVDEALHPEEVSLWIKR
jgi:hypothetical protein